VHAETSEQSARPVGELPVWAPVLAASLRELLPALADEVVAAVAADVPAYARPLQGAFGRGVRRGVEEALGHFVLVLEGQEPVDAPQGRRTSLALGRGELRAGRTLDALLGAYRVGARVSWRRMADAASALDLDADALVRLGELIYSYIDTLSAATVEGYAAEQSIVAGERDRLRVRLADLLVAGAEPALLDAAAADASWSPPAEVAVLAVATAQAGTVVARLSDHVVLHPVGEEPSLVVATITPGEAGRSAVEARLQHLTAAIGPLVPWHEAHRSAARARAAFDLAARGVLPAGKPLWTDEHLADLALHADPAAGADLARLRLAPFDTLPAPARDRLAATLQAWLLLDGARSAVAERLHVHPQTVRYRLAQLRELFGETLDDAEARFELGLALRLARGRFTGPARSLPGAPSG